MGGKRKSLIAISLLGALLIAAFTVLAMGNARVWLDEAAIMSATDAQVVFYGAIAACGLILIGMIATITTPRK